MTTKVCKSCGQTKPYDPSAKQHSKASGFHGSKCWPCYLRYQTTERYTTALPAEAEASGPPPVDLAHELTMFQRHLNMQISVLYQAIAANTAKLEALTNQLQQNATKHLL